MEDNKDMLENEELENKESSKKVLLGIFGTMILMVAIVGVSFAMFYFSMSLSDQNSITTGYISMDFADRTYIDIKDALPISDEQGKKLTGDKYSMEFTVGATFGGYSSVTYEISAIDDTSHHSNKLADNNLKVYIYEKNNEQNSLLSLYSDLKQPTFHSDIIGAAHRQDKLLLTDTLKYDGKNKRVFKTYVLKMWIDDNTEDLKESKTFKLRLRVDAHQNR